MKTIWKFPLKTQDRQTVLLPVGAKALTVQLQHGYACLWALVDDDEMAKVNHTVWMHGTGHPADEAARYGRYLSTIQVDGGALIFHFFIGGGA